MLFLPELYCSLWDVSKLPAVSLKEPVKI